eukprot:SAG31_NODE_10569_length_1123_cov_1.301758_1_plen_84_part_00
MSFHSSPPQIATPNIDAIAAEGVALYNWHVQPVCSPTRATLMVRPVLLVVVLLLQCGLHRGGKKSSSWSSNILVVYHAYSRGC